ncbi:MAG: hypothetical protein ACR2QB_02600 [Gammaproteobacteria bacterium]
MPKPIVVLLSVFAAAWLAGSCSVLPPESDGELSELLALFPGVYAGTAPVPGAPDGRTQEIFHKIAPIDASQFGARSFYYQLSVGGPDGQPLQQKIFAFKTNPTRPGNRMRAWIFSPGQEAPNLEQRPDSWFYLEAAKLMSFPDGCTFRWRRIAGGFEGVVKADDCTFQSERFGQAVSPDMRYAVFADRLEWQETLYGPDRKVLVSTGANLIALRQSEKP